MLQIRYLKVYVNKFILVFSHPTNPPPRKLSILCTVSEAVLALPTLCKLESACITYIRACVPPEWMSLELNIAPQ